MRHIHDLLKYKKNIIETLCKHCKYRKVLRIAFYTIETLVRSTYSFSTFAFASLVYNCRTTYDMPLVSYCTIVSVSILTESQILMKY